MGKRKRLPALSDAQLEIMNIVWDEGEVTVQAVLKRLQQNRSVARNTVQTVISRLAERSWLRYRREGNKFVYRATRPRRDSQGHVLQRIIDNAFAGSADGLVRALVETQDLSTEEIERIQQLLEEVKRSKS